MKQTFTHPLLLVGMAVLPVLSVLAWLAARRRGKALISFAGLVGGALLARRRPSRLHRFVVWLGLSCLVLGIAGPRWGRDWSQSAAPGRDLVVVLDLSRSMYAEAPSRVELARAALLDLVTELRARGGNRVALILFAGRPELVCPLTHDLDHFQEAILAIDEKVPDAALGQGTRIGAALLLAVETQGRTRGSRDILLLSDGDDPARDGEWIAGAERARAEGVPIHCVGVGDSSEEGKRIPSPDGGWLMHNNAEVRTRLEKAPLREIARLTHGELLLPGTRRLPLGEHYREWSMTAAREEDSPDALPVYHQRQRWFLLPAFVLLLVSLLLAERIR